MVARPLSSEEVPMLRSHSPLLASLLLICACGDDSNGHSVVSNPVVVMPGFEAGTALPVDSGIPTLNQPGLVVDSSVAPVQDAGFVQPGLDGSALPGRVDAGA